MKPMRCLIVDDERLARASLRAMLEAIPGVEVVGEADRPKRAVAAVQELRPDVMLLDVQMPDGGGFAVLETLDHLPSVVFVTAYDQYALRAFEVNAVDYVLKPVDPERLHQALERAGQQQRDEVARATAGPLESTDVIWLELGSSGHFRPVQDLVVIEADCKYSKVLCADGCDYLIRQSLTEWLRRLPEPQFLQVTRSLIINVEQIHSLQFVDRGARLVLGEKHHPVEIGRAGADRLREWTKPADKVMS